MHRLFLTPVFKFLFSVVLMGAVLHGQEVDLPQNRVIDKVWIRQVDGFSKQTYKDSVLKLVEAYEQASMVKLAPGEKRKVGIKVFTNSGAGLRTPFALVDSVIELLIDRGYQKSELFIIDMHTDALWRSGYISSRADSTKQYNGVPVHALDEGSYYDPEWYYDSPLPSQYVAEAKIAPGGGYILNKAFEDDRKSFLPVPLMLDVDFWINLPVVSDHPSLGISGALANATLWNISNQYRFMRNTAGASAAIAEIAAIPELRNNLAFTIVSLEKFQYMGGPIFNSGYVRELPEIYLSTNSVALDRIFLEKVNRARESMGFNPVSPIPPVFDYAVSLSLGQYERGSYEVLTLN